MADLNYIKSGGVKRYPVDKIAREKVQAVEDYIKQIKETGIATSWNQLLDKPFYEEENITTVEVYNGEISFVSNQAVLAVPVDTSKEHIIKLNKEYTFTPVNDWVSLGDYTVYYNGTNFTIKYIGTEAPVSSITLTEVTKEVIVHKLDRKFLDMECKLQELSLNKNINSNVSSPVGVGNEPYEKLKGCEFIYIKCGDDGTDVLGKFKLMKVYNTSLDKTGEIYRTKEYHYEYMEATAEKSAKHIYTLLINENNQVMLKYYKTWFQNGNVTVAGDLSMRALLIPNVKVEGLE